jgi:hypothetical protein
MLKGLGTTLDGAVSLLTALLFSLIGYVLGYLGGLALSAALDYAGGVKSPLLSGGLGGGCAALAFALLRLSEKKLVAYLAIPFAVAAGVAAAALIEMPPLPGDDMYAHVLSGCLFGGATALVIILLLRK